MSIGLKIFLSPKIKIWFVPFVFSGCLAGWRGAAPRYHPPSAELRGRPPPFRIFAGGLPLRRRRRNAFELIQEYCTRQEKSKNFGSPSLLPAGRQEARR